MPGNENSKLIPDLLSAFLGKAPKRQNVASQFRCGTFSLGQLVEAVKDLAGGPWTAMRKGLWANAGDMHQTLPFWGDSSNFELFGSQTARFLSQTARLFVRLIKICVLFWQLGNPGDLGMLQKTRKLLTICGTNAELKVHEKAGLQALITWKCLCNAIEAPSANPCGYTC